MSSATQPPEGSAIVYSQGAFNTPNGKTAHGLVRRGGRYRVLAVVDEAWAGHDAGQVLDGRPVGIPIFASVASAVEALKAQDMGEGTGAEGTGATHLVIGLAPDGGRLDPRAREDVKLALALGLDVDAGLHDFLSEDEEIAALAHREGRTLRDIRKPPHRKDLHFFTGKIEEVTCLKVAVLGTDSAVGKRTTAWMLVDGLEEAGHRAEMIGTGQTAWLQGARYSFVLDSLVNDFLSGEIEHAVWQAWREEKPDAIVIEGQGSLMNPAYPGGYEILAAGRPDVVVLQHAPARLEYDGFPGYPIQPIEHQIQAIEVVSGKAVVALAVNHENLSPEETTAAVAELSRRTGLPACAPLRGGVAPIIRVLEAHLKKAVP